MSVDLACGGVGGGGMTAIGIDAFECGRCGHKERYEEAGRPVVLTVPSSIFVGDSRLVWASGTHDCPACGQRMTSYLWLLADEADVSGISGFSPNWG